jgi:hypothetical protein|mmetsp:Transcript_7595/g.14508  ORF Transcript_7595/g.14508 Transcript_7595/m.14508 type:complete len:349 (+) Transcript_7595:99-1145(+)
MSEVVTKDGMMIKESSTHRGHFYKYNPADGTSEWLPSVSAADMKDSRLDLSKLDSKDLTLGSATKGKGRRPLSRSSRITEVSWGTDDTSMSECICTICECGKHACPVHKWKPTQFGGNSRYREDYPAHPVEMRCKLAPKKSVTATPATPDHFRSKYGEDYPFHHPDPPASMKPKMAAAVSMPFTGTTTNRDMYCPKPVEARLKRRPQSPPKRMLPFDGTTTNREQYKAHPEVKPRESMAPPIRTIPSAPFDGSTQYKEDYPMHDVEGYRKKAPNHAPYDYGPPRGLDTEQRNAYTKKPIKLCPVLELPPKDPSAMTGHVHYTKRNPHFKYAPDLTATVGSPFTAAGCH